MQMHKINTSVPEYVSQESVAILVVDMAKNTILEANEAAYLLYFNEKNNATLIHQDSTAFLPSHSHAAFSRQEPCVFTYRHSNGRTKEIEATLFKMGGPEAFLCIWALRDITHALRSKKTSAHQEALLQQIFDTSSAAIFLINAKGVLVKANWGMAKMFGCSLEALLCSPYHALVAEEERAQSQENLAMLLEGKINAVELTRAYLRGDGTHFYGHLCAKSFCCDEGGGPSVVGVVVDVSEQKKAETALRQSETRFRTLLENIPAVAVQGYGMDGTVRYWNKASELFYGYTKAQALGKNLLELIVPPPMRESVKEAIATMATTGQPVPSSELTLQHKDGTMVEVYSSHALVCTPGCPSEFFCIDVDVSERNKAKLKQQLAASVFTYANEGIVITDGRGVIVEVNKAFMDIMGYAREEILGKTPRFFAAEQHTQPFFSQMWETLSREEHWCGELWSRQKNGTLCPHLLTVSAIKDTQGEVQHYVALYADISHMKKHEEVLERAAYCDFLTGLPNRARLMECLGEAMARATANHTFMGLAYIDLDGFKAVNDVHGHGVGDEILVIIAKRMQAQLRHNDTLARLGGDEFVAILEDLKDAQEYIQSVERLLDAARKPLHVNGVTVELSVSIGVALYPWEGCDPHGLIDRADAAMYQAKQTGKNRYMCLTKPRT